MPPRFFITHSWKDIDFARRLCADLKRNGLDGFLDAHSISPGDSIPSRIERGLTECDVYIPIFSPDALQSDWCDWEIDIAITMNRTQKGQPRIIPVIAQPCTVPSRLMHLLYINFVGRYDDALNELLTKGFGLLHPSRPIVEQAVVPVPPPSVRKSFPTRLVALGAAILVLVIVLAILCRLASDTLTNGFASLGSLPTATPSRAPSLLPTATSRPSPTTAPRLGSTKTAQDGSLMVYIPAGEFIMGSSDADKNARTDEKPQHPVYLDAFWIDKYEVTNALYKKCMDAGRCSEPLFWRNGDIPPGKENHPAAGVSWSDAAAYAQWMGGRLPTEAEWEKAACWDEANKVKHVFPWGNMFDAQKANIVESGPGDTTSVGNYSPQGDSPYGVSDMAGNVGEWVADWYSDRYYINPPKNNPKGPDSGISRVLRGGSWDFIRDFARCASRYTYDPTSRYPDVGFRVAESAP